MTVTLTKDNCLEVIYICKGLISKPNPTINEIEEIEEIVTTFPDVQFGHFLYREVYKTKSAALKCSRGDSSAHSVLYYTDIYVSELFSNIRIISTSWLKQKTWQLWLIYLIRVAWSLRFVMNYHKTMVLVLWTKYLDNGHLNSSLNYIADHSSRHFNDQTEGQLGPLVFQNLFDIFGKPCWTLNYQDPDVEAIGVFKVLGFDLYLYAFHHSAPLHVVCRRVL